MLGVFAEFERAIIQERVRAGLARAKSEGKRLGRPPIPAEKQKGIREALSRPGRTEGIRKVAARFGVDPGTVQRISRPFFNVPDKLLVAADEVDRIASFFAAVHESGPGTTRRFAAVQQVVRY